MQLWSNLLPVPSSKHFCILTFGWGFWNFQISLTCGFLMPADWNKNFAFYKIYNILGVRKEKKRLLSSYRKPKTRLVLINLLLYSLHKLSHPFRNNRSSCYKCFKNHYSEKVYRISRKILAMESLITRVAEYNPANLMKRDSTKGLIVRTILSWEKFNF